MDKICLDYNDFKELNEISCMIIFYEFRIRRDMKYCLNLFYKVLIIDNYVNVIIDNFIKLMNKYLSCFLF